MGMPSCVIYCFSLAAFNICSLCLIFVNLINICLGVFCLGFILFGTLWVSWTCVTTFFPILGKFSTIISLSIFSWPVFFFWDSYDSNVGAFHIVPPKYWSFSFSIIPSKEHPGLSSVLIQGSSKHRLLWLETFSPLAVSCKQTQDEQFDLIFSKYNGSLSCCQC